MDNLIAAAYPVMASDPFIVDLMSFGPKSLPSPFEALHREGSARLQKVLHPLAVRGEWDLSISRLRGDRQRVFQIQEALRGLKHEFDDHNFTCISEIRRIFKYAQKYFRRLAKWIETEIALQTFELIVQIFHFAAQYLLERVPQLQAECPETLEVMVRSVVGSFRSAFLRLVAAGGARGQSRVGAARPGKGAQTSDEPILRCVFVCECAILSEIGARFIRPVLHRIYQIQQTEILVVTSAPLMAQMAPSLGSVSCSVLV